LLRMGSQLTYGNAGSWGDKWKLMYSRAPWGDQVGDRFTISMIDRASLEMAYEIERVGCGAECLASLVEELA
jgi:hypothetical protein